MKLIKSLKINNSINAKYRATIRTTWLL